MLRFRFNVPLDCSYIYAAGRPIATPLSVMPSMRAPGGCSRAPLQGFNQLGVVLF